MDKVKSWTDEGAMKVLMKKKGISKINSIHPYGNMNIWTKCHGKPLNSCWEIEIWTKYVKLMEASEEK